MMNSAVFEALTEQIAHEYRNSRIYKSLAHQCKLDGLNKLAALLDKYSGEEIGHANKWIEFLADRDQALELLELPVEVLRVASLSELTQLILETEKGTTKTIYALKELACVNDEPLVAMICIQFLTEQIEEEAKARNLVALARLCAGNPAQIELLLD